MLLRTSKSIHHHQPHASTGRAARRRASAGHCEATAHHTRQAPSQAASDHGQPTPSRRSLMASIVAGALQVALSGRASAEEQALEQVEPAPLPPPPPSTTQLAEPGAAAGGSSVGAAAPPSPEPPPAAPEAPPPPPPAAPAAPPPPPAPDASFKLSEEEAQRLLAEQEEKEKARRKKGPRSRLRELQEIRAELAEKELILEEREKELLQKDQTLIVLQEELELERKLRALLSKERERAEEEAALAIGLCGGTAMLP